MDKKDIDDEFWSIVSDFGVGTLTVQTQTAGLRSRPVMPVIDRAIGEIVCIIDATWIGHSAFCEIPSVLNFLDGHTYVCLTLRGKGRGFADVRDIAAAWTGLCERSYPDGRDTPGLLAFRIVPQLADLWQLGQAHPKSRWELEGASITRRPYR